MSTHRPLAQRFRPDPERTIMTTQAPTKSRARAVRWRSMSLPAAAGIGYCTAWITSSSVGAPNPSVAASGAQVVAAFAGHGGSAMTMFALAGAPRPPPWRSWRSR